MTETSPAVRLRSVHHSFGSSTVLAGVDLEVPAGCIFGLLGRNGAGKSTAHALIAGWRRCDRGRVEVLGLPAGSAALAGRVGAMGQACPLDPDRTLRAELVRHAALLGASEADVARRVEELSLGPFLGRRAEAVSEGQRRRVELACALLGEPALLLLDEPTAGLDPIQAETVHSLLHDRPQGQTVIVSSNRLVELDGLCEHIAIIDGGRVILAEPVAPGVPIGDRFRAAVGG